MAGFCRYCGEIPSRCRCISGRPSAVESKTVQALRDSGAGMLAKDRWSSRYTLQRKSPDYTTSSNSRNGSGGPSRNNMKTTNHASARPPLPSAPQRSFTATPNSPPPTTEAEMEAFLSHSFGSVLDPREEQDKWRCSSCQARFPRDATLYPTDDPTKFYCKICFAARKSKGACGTCLKPVLGDVPFVAKDQEVWHSTCTNCSYCSTNVSDSPTTDPTGKLCCDACFASLAWRTRSQNTPSKAPAAQSAPSSPVKSSASPLKPSSNKKRNVNPAVEALRKNFSSVGLEKPLQIPAPATPPPTSPRKEKQTFAEPLSQSSAKPTAAAPIDTKTPFEERPKLPDSCAACSQSLFSIAQHGSKVIKLHDGTTYHSSCFKCSVCQHGFSGLQYSVEAGKPVHPDCAPEPEPIVTPVPRPSSSQEVRSSNSSPTKSVGPSLPRSKPLPALADVAQQQPQNVKRPTYTRQNTSPLPVLSKLGKGPVCAQCTKAITFLDRKVSAGGFEWHESCCRCASCETQLVAPRVVDGVAKCVHCRFGSRP